MWIPDSRFLVPRAARPRAKKLDDVGLREEVDA
jgi:hypothetical protein